MFPIFSITEAALAKLQFTAALLLLAPLAVAALAAAAVALFCSFNLKYLSACFKIEL